MPFFPVYLILGLLILALMTLMWLVSLPLKNSSIVDIFWGTGFVVTAWAAFFITPDVPTAPKLLICILVTIWGLRLSVHIFIRNHGKPEDFRYQKWRQEAGKSWWLRSYFRVFLLQGVLMWIISAPLLAAQMTPRPLFWLDFVAIAVWFIGFFFEAAGDWQLARFKSNPANKGRVLSSGVWRYTRHPNYFGDAAQWWGFYLIAAASGGWWTVFSPILMTLFLMRVSGVTLLEKTLSKEKPGYSDYMETTSEFIPWLPRKK
jgi:steroid 5-alpha reductase family enzyme